MDHFHYRDGRLHAEDVDLEALAAAYGTPAYVYSRATLTRHFRVMTEALGDQPHLICYAVKANANLAVLNVLARLGSGFDIVSGGELARVLQAGGDPAKVVFSGVGKRAAELEQALSVGIRCFNVESIAELERLDRIARAHGVAAPVSLRVNPDVDAQTHPYIATGLKDNKFGIAISEAEAAYARAADAPGIRVVGVDCHIGSQLTKTAPFVDALDRVLKLVDRLAEQGIALQHLDVGGGLGIRYRDETPPDPAAYAAALRERLAGRALELILEPGRVLVGNAGILLTRVEYLKDQSERHFAIVDAGMNDLLRPALYQAWQEIVTVREQPDRPEAVYDVVGPVCETADFLGKARPLRIAEGDLLAVRSAGAYGFVMASQYNARPRPPELLVDGDRIHVARTRESVNDLWAGESLLPD
ncbi:MAG TPA: diaminopimelate decarboxylase [Candidatus Macondimonas sp.]|nr:diaminopimelate decarboxylase [Candidatus Macondimonas sp.]